MGVCQRKDTLASDTLVSGMNVSVGTVTVCDASLTVLAPYFGVTSVHCVGVLVITGDRHIITDTFETSIGRARVLVAALRIGDARNDLDASTCIEITLESRTALLVTRTFVDIPVYTACRRVACLVSHQIPIITDEGATEVARAVPAGLYSIADTCVSAVGVFRAGLGV